MAHRTDLDGNAYSTEGNLNEFKAIGMSSPRFQFGNVVVVDIENIGVIVKTWGNRGVYSYDVYVRYSSTVSSYMEDEIQHFVYSKELAEDEKDFYP